jgi:hypothetical protein
MMRANFIPALCWDWPIVPGKIMQGRPEGGGSLQHMLLQHIKPNIALMNDCPGWRLELSASLFLMEFVSLRLV